MILKAIHKMPIMRWIFHDFLTQKLNNMIQRRKKICPKCGRRLWLRDFYRQATGYFSPYCKECTRAAKREEYARNRKVPNRLYQDYFGRLIEHKDHSTRIYWSEYMVQKLKRLFPTTKNEDLAIEFNMSQRTVARKARELGLKKDKDWMQALARKSCQYMRVLNMCYGNSGQFKKGEHASKDTEFKKSV